MKKWITFAALSAIACAASAMLPYMSDLATTATSLTEGTAGSHSTPGMMLAGLGLMVVIGMRRSRK